MIKRTIDIENPSYLRIKFNQLIIEQKKQIVAQIPVEDIGILILQHPAITMTQAVVISCQENNTVLVFCDSRRLPISVSLPITSANSLHSTILQKQLTVTPVRKKQIWKQVVQQKIIQQSETLKRFGKEHEKVALIARRVQSGDKSNCESQAAQRYWRLLFGDSFRRDTTLEGVNVLLNYGYAIVRAMVARAIVGSGLHPALGIYHHNQYNGLNLADDLMEPFRPWVDQLVFQLSSQDKFEINKDTKQVLLQVPAQKVNYNGKIMPFMVSCHYLIADLKRIYHDKSLKLKYPELDKPISC
ncbi:MAG: type II CRISPR-associated endonuclease Cas1 [Deltaproteobacteria bacterium]|nr:type II CRISPR-associated endonuclease Cas1 [Deltaproteobacteria bacterium]